MFFSSILQNSSEETSLDCRMNLYNSASDILNFDAEARLGKTRKRNNNKKIFLFLLIVYLFANLHLLSNTRKKEHLFRCSPKH
jgi:hypothetical protein